MNPFQQGTSFNQEGLGRKSDYGDFQGTGDWAQTSPTQDSPLIIDPAMQDLSLTYAANQQPGTCPGRGIHQQLIADYQHGLASATMQFPARLATQPINIAPALLFTSNMEPGDYNTVPGLSYPNSAPSVMSSDPGHPYASPNPYTYSVHLSPAPAPFFGGRGRPSETNQGPSMRVAKPTRSRARNSSRSSNSNNLQPPPNRHRRASEPGKRPIPAASIGKRKRDLPDGRIQCEHCIETFKMPADRERHVKVRHPEVAMVSTVWVCQNRQNQIPPGYERWIPLDRCKSCMQGKRYNASHNAEEHLRRKHFYPRIPGSRPQNDGERRGGKGGGKDPDVQYLKEYWIEKTDICHKALCDCGYPHEDLPDQSAVRRPSRSTGASHLDVEMGDDASEASWEAQSSVSGGISPVVTDNQEYHSPTNPLPIWGQQSPMMPPSHFGFSPTQPSSFSSGSSFLPPSTFNMTRGSRPSLTNSQQNSGTSLGSSMYSPNMTHQDNPEFSPDLEDFQNPFGDPSSHS